MADRNDNVLTNFDEQLTRWAEFYEDYFNDPAQTGTNNDPISVSSVPQRAHNSKPVNWNSIEYSSRRMKQYKAPGANDLPIDIFKCSKISTEMD